MGFQLYVKILMPDILRYQGNMSNYVKESHLITDKVKNSDERFYNHGRDFWLHLTKSASELYHLLIQIAQRYVTIVVPRI